MEHYKRTLMKGIGSGIRRALDEWPQIDFLDDCEGSLFTAKIYRDFYSCLSKLHASIKSCALAGTPRFRVERRCNRVRKTSNTAHKNKKRYSSIYCSPQSVE